MTPNRQPVPSDTRAGTNEQAPVETYVPPARPYYEVLYGTSQHNETAIGMFHHTPTRHATPPSEIHRFVTASGHRNDSNAPQAKHTRRNGATRTHRRPVLVGRDG